MSVDIKQFLTQYKDKRTGQDLFEHLSNVLGKVLLDNPKNAFDSFEDYSHSVKLSGFNYKNPLKDDNSKQFRENFDEIRKFAELALGNLGGKPVSENPEEEVEAPGPTGYVQNLIDLFKKYEWAGISLAEEEAYHLQKALTKLSVNTKARSVRFWGKIFGSEKDYFVAELDGYEPEGEQEEPPADAEPRGQDGVNKFTYFVANDVLGDWKELPITTPKQLTSARKIKHILTGNLDAKIITNPFFFGEEKHYLKAQIVRISTSTALYPRGLYKITEDDETQRAIEAQEDPVYVYPTLKEASRLDAWVHSTTSILNEGKTVHSEPPEEFEGDRDEEMKKIQQKDPWEPRLKPINQDIHPQTKRPLWTIRVLGDKNEYETLAFNRPVNNRSLILLKSLTWPGMNVLYTNTNLENIYFGYGTKADLAPYYPKMTQTVLEEPEDQEEQPEPNPLNAEEQNNQGEGQEENPEQQNEEEEEDAE